MAVSISPVSEVSLRSRGGSPKLEALHTLPYEFVMDAQVLEPAVLMSTPAILPLPATCGQSSMMQGNYSACVVFKQFFSGLNHYQKAAYF